MNRKKTGLDMSVINQMILGAVTNVPFVRKLIFLTILLTAITVAMGSLTARMMLRDFIPGQPAPVVQGAPLTPAPTNEEGFERPDNDPPLYHQQTAPEPARERQSEPSPSRRAEAEEIRKLIRSNPL